MEGEKKKEKKNGGKQKENNRLERLRKTDGTHRDSHQDIFWKARFGGKPQHFPNSTLFLLLGTIEKISGQTTQCRTRSHFKT
jgi:hypothetical protein